LKLSIRQNHRLWLVFSYVGGFLLPLGMLEVHIYFIFPLILLFLLQYWYIYQVKCPYCRHLLLYNKSLGNFYVWTPWIPENCTKCGEKFD
jgi:hypothetical protein